MTREEILAAKAIAKYEADPAAEAKRRWPDFHFEVKKEGRRSFVFAYWTRAGKKRGFKDPLPPRYNAVDIRYGVDRCALGALLKAEHDRIAGMA